MVKASIFWWNTFASELFLKLSFLFRFIRSWNSLVCFKFCIHFCFPHQIALIKVYFGGSKEHSTDVRLIFVNIPYAWDFSSLAVYFNLISNSMKITTHLLILAVAVFGNSSSVADRYSSGMRSAWKAKKLPFAICLSDVVPVQ